MEQGSGFISTANAIDVKTLKTKAGILCQFCYGNWALKLKDYLSASRRLVRLGAVEEYF